MKKIYIHIGTHKTGTSAIQRALQLAEYDMRKENLVYIPHEKSPEVILKFVLATSFSSNDISIGKRFFNKWIDSCADSSSLVFSHEDLSGNPFDGYKNSYCIAQALREMTKGSEVIIIVYLRRQDFFVESFYDMRIRGGGHRTFNDFNENVIKGNTLNWHELLKNYAHFFGKENIITHKYDKNSLPEKNSLIIDFANIISSETLRNVSLAQFYNSGINRDALEIIKLSNKYLDKKGKANLKKSFENSFSKLPFSKNSFFTIEKRKQFMENFSKSNDLVAKEYFKDDLSPIFSEVTQEKDGTNSYGGLTTESVARILSLAIVDIQSRLDEPVSLSILIKLIKKIFIIVDIIIKNIFNLSPFFKKTARYIVEKSRSN